MGSAEKGSALASKKRIGIDETPSRDCESITALGYVVPGTHAEAAWGRSFQRSSPEGSQALSFVTSCAAQGDQRLIGFGLGCAR